MPLKLSDLKKSGFNVVGNKMLPATKSKSKYRNKSIEIDGIKFHSTKEGKYYSDLKTKKSLGEIKDFKMQVCYEIKINDIHIANYFLDFLVEYLDNTYDYIDVKGKDKVSNKWIKTDVFKLKKKLVEAIYGINIKMI